MLEMQRGFIEYEHEPGLDPSDYHLPDEHRQVHEYRQQFRDLAMKVVDLAHQEKGSKR